MSKYGQTAVAVVIGLSLSLYWKLSSHLYGRGSHVALLMLLVLTAVISAGLLRAAKLLEFVAKSWGMQRYRARLFGMTAEGKYGQVLLRHLVSLSHDQARSRGFLGVVCATADDTEAAKVCPPQANYVSQILVAKDLGHGRTKSMTWGTAKGVDSDLRVFLDPRLQL